MKKLKALIIDDERLARKDLISMLAEHEHIEVVGEADCIATAKQLIVQCDPDVIFLDIQMPGESGFDLFESTDIHAKIIFVTAFDEYAFKAFEVNALDYLLKPISPVRLKKTLGRLSGEDLEEKTSKQPLAMNDQLFLLFNTHYRFLKIDSIVYISSSGDYSEVHLNNGQQGLTGKPMHEWENRLPGNIFCRIHRSTIINMDYAVNIEKWKNNSYRVFLKDIDEPFVISRRYASSIKSMKK
jgi:two-component system, LytTR family, response regulator